MIIANSTSHLFARSVTVLFRMLDHFNICLCNLPMPWLGKASSKQANNWNRGVHWTFKNLFVCYIRLIRTTLRRRMLHLFYLWPKRNRSDHDNSHNSNWHWLPYNDNFVDFPHVILCTWNSVYVLPLQFIWHSSTWQYSSASSSDTLVPHGPYVHRTISIAVQ